MGDWTHPKKISEPHSVLQSQCVEKIVSRLIPIHEYPTKPPTRLLLGKVLLRSTKAQPRSTWRRGHDCCGAKNLQRVILESAAKNPSAY